MSEVDAWTPPSSRVSEPAPVRAPTTTSATVSGVAVRQSASRIAWKTCSRTGCSGEMIVLTRLSRWAEGTTPIEPPATARRAGRYDAAATGYSNLIEQFPRDGRASLASYELGRMYLDAMHQPGRAIAPLRRAISSAPRGASYREDAMARLVAAYSRSNQTEACMQARDRYLAEYASGLHRTAVSRSCAVE